ncbi:hypothetical protein [Sphingomonas sp. IW22]|uniref:hypothetical protein n=1 Tax=Sphingomonas sp. IW22 TaxID=3242489 RepID=UPI0035221CDC
MTLEDRIRADLGRKVMGLISPQLERELNLALRVLPPDQVSLLAVELATVLAGACLLVPVQFAADDKREALFDTSLEWLHERLKVRRDEILTALDQQTSKSGAR